MLQGRKDVGHPVDVATGTVYSTHEDISSIPGKVGLTWKRRYSTALLEMPSSPLGTGWTTCYFATLTQDKGEFQFITPEGEIEIFADPEGTVDRGGIVRNLGTFQELAKQGGRYIVTRWDVDTGEIERYVFKEGRKGETWPLASIEDVTRQGLDMLYDKQGLLTGIQQRLEKRTLLIEYTSGNRISSVSFLMPENKRQVLARYTYDKNGRLRTAYNALGYADCYKYDSKSRMTREMLKDGGDFYFKYNEQGRCIKTSGLFRYDEKTFRYLDHIGWTEVTNSLGHVTRYQWLRSGQVACEVDPLGGEKQTEYDEHGRVVARIDANGAATKYKYDEQGNRCKIVDALGNEYLLTFNNHHLSVVLTDPAGGVWKREYDGANRLVATEDAMSSRWIVVYDDRGSTVSVTAPNGACKRQIFSDTGVLLEATDWEGNSTRHRLDSLGRIVESIGPLGNVTKFRYDLLGNILEFILPDGSQIKCTYDGGGNLDSLADSVRSTTTYRYGTCGRILEVTSGLGSIVRYSWMSEPRQLEKVINEKREIYKFVYDEAGRVIGEKAFDDREQSFLYDRAGRLVAQINGNNEKIALKRDHIGRVTHQILADGTSASFKYDHLGYLVAAVNSNCEVLFERDPLHRVIREMQDSYSVESAYDAAGNLIQTTTNLEHRADYIVDGNGLLTRLVIGNQQPLEFLRNAERQEASRQLPGGIRLDQEYDAAGRLVEQRVGHGRLVRNEATVLPAARAIIRRKYGYERCDTLTSIKDDYWGEVNYIYDAAERLLQALRETSTGDHFNYDSAGNLTNMSTDVGEVSLNYRSGNRLLQKGHTKYFYDNNGRLVKQIEEHGGDNFREWHYTWDGLDQLKSVRTPDNEVWHYAYDALGRRIFKKGPNKQIRYVWDQNVIIHEIVNDHLESTWIFDHYTFKPLCKLHDGDVYSVIADHLGTPRELVDMNGNIVWSADYTSWGEVKQTRSQKIDCPIRFQGQWLDAETGLHYNRFRYYDPRLGRFISTDPIQLAGGLNVYAYTRNPVNWVDPFGRNEGCNDDDESPNQMETYYHYSRDPPESFANGLWSGSAATTLPGLGSTTASQGLGIPPPLYQYPVTIDPSVTPVTPPRPVASSNRYAGGLPEVFFSRGTPPGSVGTPTEVPQT